MLQVHSAQSSVAAQQSELEAYNTAEASIDSALLLEQVLILVFSVLYHSS
jgi:V-type H+-transporting ATPase subunit a